MILLGTQLPTGGVDDKQVICNNLQNHFWSHLHFFAPLVSDDQVSATVDHQMNFSVDPRCSRSLNKRRVSLGVFDKCCLLTNFLQENGRYEMIQRSWTIGVASSILRFSGWSGKSLHKEKTQVRICWIFRSHRGQGWLDTHILLGLFLSYWALD